MQMPSATIPASSSSLLSFASRERHRFRNKSSLDDYYPPLELPLRWRDPSPEYPPLELPLKWRNPLPDHLIRKQPAAIVHDTPQLGPHSVNHDSSFASTLNQDRNPASLPFATRSHLHITTKPVYETSFPRDSIDSDSLQCDLKVATEAEEAVATAIVENSSPYNREVESQEKSLPGELTSKLIPLQSIKSMDLSNKAFTEDSINTASKAVEKLAAQEYCFKLAMGVDSYSMSHEGLSPVDVAKQDHLVSQHQVQLRSDLPTRHRHPLGSVSTELLGSISTSCVLYKSRLPNLRVHPDVEADGRERREDIGGCHQG
ncbi:hypothetical protein M5K25_006334 [Dendrobium thyrsiflorum]|uniref:Uncharacterized protein n=1 Tax=Dendrobium thyrsiflorum TaxID=117978 RepID=A0ABD0VI30_DENTH